MKLNHVVTKLSVFTMVGVMALSGTGTAFAADHNTNVNSKRDLKPQRGNFEEMSTIYKSALEELVSDGTITQAQADAITASKTSKECKDGNINSSGEHKNPFSELVTAGTITQTQLDAIQEAMKTARESGKTMSDILTELVSAETITQEQADAITAKMPVRDGKAAKTTEHKSPFSELVTAGTITQTQLDAIQEAMKTARESGKTMSDILTELVSAETITQTQADAITAKMPVRDDKAAKTAEHKSPFSELVTSGTITQTQADALWNAVKEAMQTARTSEK